MDPSVKSEVLVKTEKPEGRARKRRWGKDLNNTPPPANRVYIANIPTFVTDTQLTSFLNAAVSTLHPSVTSISFIQVIIVPDKHFAALSLKNLNEVSLILELDGVEWEGSQLRIRPSKGIKFVEPTTTIPNVPRSKVPEGDKIYLLDLPEEFDEGQLKKTAAMYGQLKAWNIAIDYNLNQPLGYATFSYINPQHMDAAVTAMDGLPISGVNIKAVRASVLFKDSIYAKENGCKYINVPSLIPNGSPSPSNSSNSSLNLGSVASSVDSERARVQRIIAMNPALIHTLPPHLLALVQDPNTPLTNTATALALIGASSNNSNTSVNDNHPMFIPSRVICIHNIVTAKELEDDHATIMPLIAAEIKRFGTITDWRVLADNILVEYVDVETAQNAALALVGRRFTKRTVLISYKSDDDWARMKLLTQCKKFDLSIIELAEANTYEEEDTSVSREMRRCTALMIVPNK